MDKTVKQNKQKPSLWHQFASLIRWFSVIVCTSIMYISSLICYLIDRKGRLSHAHHRYWARAVLFLVGARLKIYGTETIDQEKTYVIASNHEGNVDIPALIGSLPLQFKFAAKEELFRIPIFGGTLRHAGYVPIKRGSGMENARKVIKDLAQKIEEGFCILMFPEGTRTRDGKLRAFKTGTFRLSQTTETEILPVAIYGSQRGQSAGEWIIRPGNIVINVGQPIKPLAPPAGQSHSEENVNKLKGLCREAIIKLYEEAQALDKESLPENLKVKACAKG